MVGRVPKNASELGLNFMRLAIIGSNYINIDKNSRKGTEIFTYSLIQSLATHAKANSLKITAFASGKSKLPVPIESIDYLPSNSYKNIHEYNKHFIFELALISKAISREKEFDVYHMNIGDGDLILPFAQFVSKPIVITLHRIIDEEYTRKYFSLFQENKNVHFISISNYQRKILPHINYLTTIYHGIDTSVFQFHATGGNIIMWAGRAIPSKGPDVVIETATQMKKETVLYGISKPEHKQWLYENILKKIETNPSIHFITDKNRYELIPFFQTSKLFLFPTTEEHFGLVLIEAMSCGTPVVAYGVGSIPEIVKDGVTGFIVNSSDKEIQGDWIIKKTGIEGLKEAVEKIYAMSEKEYLAMRKACRDHVEKNFRIQRMAQQYIETYKKVIALNQQS